MESFVKWLLGSLFCICFILYKSFEEDLPQTDYEHLKTQRKEMSPDYLMSKVSFFHTTPKSVQISYSDTEAWNQGFQLPKKDELDEPVQYKIIGMNAHIMPSSAQVQIFDIQGRELMQFNLEEEVRLDFSDPKILNQTLQIVISYQRDDGVLCYTSLPPINSAPSLKEEIKSLPKTESLPKNLKTTVCNKVAEAV